MAGLHLDEFSKSQCPAAGKNFIFPLRFAKISGMVCSALAQMCHSCRVNWCCNLGCLMCRGHQGLPPALVPWYAKGEG